MKNRFTCIKQLGLLFLFFLSFSASLSSQTCDNTNPYFTFSYTGPDTILVGPNCFGTLTWPDTGPDAPNVQCMPSFTCQVNFFDFSMALTGYAKGAQVRAGTNVSVYYTLQGVVNPGNISVLDTFCFDIFFYDDTEPTFSAPPPADLTVDCVNDIPAPTGIMANDNCDASFPKNITPTDSGTAMLCAGGTLIRSWTAVDSSGNSKTISQMITVLPDTTRPVISVLPMSETVPCESADYTTWLADQRNTVSNSASDNCGISMISDNAPAVFPMSCGRLNVTFTVEDSCGNIQTALAFYEITDSQTPVITGVGVSDTIRQSCDVAIPALPSVNASDNCDFELVFLETNSQTNTGGCSDFDFQIVRTWTATDSCGNTATHRQVIIVKDQNPPDFTPPPAITINCGDPRDPSSTGEPTGVSDNCDASPLITWRDIQSDTQACPQNILITREWRVTDTCGNSSIRTQVITVADNVAPDFTVPADTTVDCQFAGNLDVTGRPTGLADNCDPNPKITFSDVSSNVICANIYAITRTWTAEDTCGNTRSKIQLISVIDTILPTIVKPALDVTVFCDDVTSGDDAFADWINNHGNAAATDNCSQANDLQWLAFNSGTGTPASLPAKVCNGPDFQVLRQQAVDFVVFDQCGNSDTTSATFILKDTVPPQLINCPQNISAENDPGFCQATIILPPPRIRDDCDSTTQNFVFTKIGVITSNGPFGDPDILVNPLDIPINVGLPTLTVLSDLQIKVDLVNMDAESSTELFNIFDENGNLLGTSNRAATQCGNSTTIFTISNPATIYDWLRDEFIQLRLEPVVQANLPGRFSINNICANARVEVSVSFTGVVANGVIFEYAVNDGARVVVDPIQPFAESFDVGTSEVTYYVTDCAGNVDSCAFMITVEDTEGPTIICPPSMDVNLDPDQCTKSIQLPLPSAVTDNCALPGQFDQMAPTALSDQWISFYEDPNLSDFLANDKSITFTGITGNSFGLGGILTVHLVGDVESTGEFFTVFGENNTLLGTTEVGQAHVTPGNCATPGQATFILPPSTLNQWAADGNIQINLVSNTNIPVPPGGPGSGINPCNGNVSMTGQVDSVSRAWATLTFNQISPTYFSTGATVIQPTVLSPSNPPTHTFNGGVSTIFYVVEDSHGNRDTCSFDLNVRDIEPPVAVCEPSIVRINPAGSVNDTISPMDIGARSTDNCAIDTMFVQPSIFTCDLIDQTVNVQLIVRDVFGNQDTCATFVRIEGIEPEPSFLYFCGSDTLFLFANPPPAPGNIIYTYRWFGPSGNLISTRQNPIIADLSNFTAGNYCVEIQGLTGCTTEACVNIPVDLRPPQPLVNAPSQVCWDGNNLVLTTTPPPGVSKPVQYRWYQGTFPNGTLLGASSTPSFAVAPPFNIAPNSEQIRCYYLVLDIEGCESQPSNEVCVTIVRPPDAVVSDPVLTLCEGEELRLRSPITVPNLSFQWTGPVFVSGSGPNVLVTDSVDFSLHAGNYSLIILRSGCPSNSATTIVNVLEKPDIRPSIFPTQVNVCEGRQFSLNTNLVGVNAYIWNNPINPITTSTNSIVVTANTFHTGEWSVVGVINYASKSCFSDPSSPANVTVNTFQGNVVATAAPNPVCEGESIQLATSPSLSNASYQWTDPGGAIISALQNPLITNIRQNKAGTYRVRVTNSFGCFKEGTVDVSVAQGVEVVAVSNDAPNCFTTNTPVQLSLIVFPPDIDSSYTYQWMGPCNFVSTDSLAIVPNVGNDCKGVYQVIVTNGNGCKSAPRTTVIDGLGPFTTPVVSKSPDKAIYCEGEALTLTTTGYNGQNVQYEWTTRMGVFTTTTPSLIIDSLTVLGHNGNVSVTVNVDGCETNSSGQLNLRVNPVPVAIPRAEAPCEGGTLRLFGGYSPAGGSPTFEWTAPTGAFSVRDPVIASANPNIHNGTYTLVVNLGGCRSMPVSVDVEITEAPRLPVPLPAANVCLNGMDTLVLCINPNSATAGASYLWINQFGDTLGRTTAPCLSVTDLSRYVEGSFPFFVSSAKDGCVTRNSAPIVVNFNTVPNNNADAGADFSVCEDDLVMLAAMPPDRGQGCWRFLGSLSGVNVTNPCQSTTSVSGLAPGNVYDFQWALSNGACENYDLDTVQVTIFEVENANAGPARIDTCLVNSIRLRAVPSLSGLGFWSQSQVQEQLGVVITDPSDPGTEVTFQNPGLYRFTWVIPDIVCGGDSDITDVNISLGNPNAGQNMEDCGDGCTFLSANPTQNGVWTAVNQAVTFLDNTDPTTEACGLVNGTNLLIWTIDGGVCGDKSRDTLMVSYKLSPQAVDDIVAIPFANSSQFNVAQNDLETGTFFITIATPPARGILENLGSGNLRYTPELNFIGDDSAVYQICSADPSCPCSEATIIFQVGKNVEGCDPPSIITPNGDDVNDAFVIPCLALPGQFPENELIIFNQWGDEVFRKSPYTNDWIGTFNGQELPGGTYFYVLDLKTGDKPITGYLVIQR